MARRADDVARRKPDKERIEETVFNFGVFVQRTHPHVRMTGKMIQPKIAKTNRTISDPLFKTGSPLKNAPEILALTWLPELHLNPVAGGRAWA